jgi:hypothetical protein
MRTAIHLYHKNEAGHLEDIDEQPSEMTQLIDENEQLRFLIHVLVWLLVIVLVLLIWSFTA